MELAIKAATADTRIGSHSDIRETMRPSRKRDESVLQLMNVTGVTHRSRGPDSARKVAASRVSTKERVARSFSPLRSTRDVTARRTPYTTTTAEPATDPRSLRWWWVPDVG